MVNGRASLQRSTYRGNQTAEMTSFWKEARRFFVPAYELPLDKMIEIGAALLQSVPPPTQEGPPAPFLPVVVTREDIHALAEFIVMGVEASRKDNLKELIIELALEDPQLWILP